MFRRPALCLLTLLATSTARGATYAASVLYPLNVPRGFNSLNYLHTIDVAKDTLGQGPITGPAAYAHALLWSNASGTAADLNPTDVAGLENSDIDGSDGRQQVGGGWGTATGGSTAGHALIWSGTATQPRSIT